MPPRSSSPSLLAQLDAFEQRQAKAEEQPEDVRWSEWCPHKPIPNQQRFLDLECLEAMYGGAAGGGKSDALLMAALQYVDVPGYAAILFRRTYADLALPDAIMARSHDWLAGTKAHWTGDTKTWVFPSGAKLAFGYLDSDAHKFRYQSAQFQFVGFDELTQFPRAWYLYLFSRLRRPVGVAAPLRMRGATNPGGIGHKWVKERFIDRPEARVFIPSKLEDNPHIDQAEYRQSLANLDETTRRQLEDGLWIQDTSGLVYKLSRGRNQVSLPQMDGEWRRILSLDFGTTNATALVELAWKKHTKTVYGLSSWKRTGMIPAEVGEEVSGLLETRSYDRIIGDIGGLGKGFVEEMRRRYQIPIEAAQKQNKLGYIMLFNGACERAEFVVARDTNDAYWEEADELPWADEDHTAEAAGFENHICDAYLYGWRAAYAYAEPDPPPKDTQDEGAMLKAEAIRKAAERQRKQDRMLRRAVMR